MSAEPTISIKIERLIALGRSIKVVDGLNELAWDIRRKNLNEAYKAAVTSEEISRSLAYSTGIMHALKVQGYCLWRFSDYSASMNKSTEALKYAQEMQDLKSQADILNSIGAVYMFLKDHQNRLKCNLECLRIREEIGDEDGVSGSLNNLGETYMEMGDTEKAKEYLVKCLEYAHSSPDARGWAYHNLGVLALRLGNFDQGVEYLQSSIDITEPNDYVILTCNSYLQMARCLGASGHPAQQLEMLEKGLQLASEANAREEMHQFHLALSEYFEGRGDVSKAFAHFKLFNSIHSLVYNEENNNTIRNLKNQFEIESLQKEAEIERLKHIELKKAFDEIDQQKRLVERKNQAINDSLHYAQRIQSAILYNEKELQETGLTHFKVFLPKDVVSGDFYWSKQVGSYFYLAVVDCTGHGVPGAFMSMLGVAFLNEISSTQLLPSTDDMLNQLREKVITVLRQKGASDDANDGMDMSLIRLDLDTLEMQFSGAMNPAYVVRNGEIITLKGDRMPIGYSPVQKPFASEEFELEEGDWLLMSTDGLADQFGGERSRKVGYQQFREWLLESVVQPHPDKYILKRLKDWKGKETQIDDITLIGLKV